MTVELSLERFEALAAAFGGNIGRWPRAERDAAIGLTASRPAETGRLLQAAQILDVLLGAAPAEAPSSALLGAILRNASLKDEPARLWRWVMGFGVGAALAGTAAAGVAAGLVIAPASIGTTRAPVRADPIAEASVLLGDAPDLADG